MSYGEDVWLAHTNERGRTATRSAYALGRVGNAEEVAQTALFLASADASFITGQAIDVDGGLCAINPEVVVSRLAAKL